MLRYFIFLFLLMQTAQSAIEYVNDGDLDDGLDSNPYDRHNMQERYYQILSDLHDLFQETTDDNAESRNEEYDDFNFLRQKKDDRIDKILGEVTNVLDNIKSNLIKFSNNGVLTLEVPVTKESRRYKRDVSNETDVAVLEAEDDSTDNNDTLTESPALATEEVEVVENKNDTTVVLRTESADNDTESVSGRRMIVADIKTTSRVKDKLLSYLEDTFNEVERKIKPLTNIKIALSNDDHYRIGYIIATIDTMEVNLKKLKNDMNLHQQHWDDEKILDLFDKIKASNTVATSLIESLKNYLPHH